MNRIKALAFNFIIISLVLISCDSNNDSPAPILIEGQLSDNASEMIYLIESQDVQDFKHYFQVLDSVKLDSSGAFSFSFIPSENNFYQLRGESGFNLFYDKNFYLSSGDTIHILENEENYKLTGNAALLNQVQWDMADTFQTQSYRKLQRQSTRLEPQDYVDYAMGLRSKKDSLLSVITSKNTFPEEYLAYLSTQIELNFISQFWFYLRYHSYYTHDNWGYLDKDSLNFDFQSFWKRDTTFYFLEDYGPCLQGYVSDIYENTHSTIEDSIKWKTKLMDVFTIIKESFSGIERDKAMANITQDFWMYLSGDTEKFYSDLKEIDAYFKANNTSGIFYAFFNDEYQGYLNIAPGEKAPNFTLPDSSGNMVSLSDFKGKVIYIDIWGTWCYPCIQSIPKHMELQKNLQHDDLIYMYVALEYEEENILAWKKFIAERDWPGIHLVAEKQFHNEELKGYKLRAAPTYIVIDQEGNFVSPNAEGPEVVKSKLEKLLQ